jgi:hypothetical protein
MKRFIIPFTAFTMLFVSAALIANYYKAKPGYHWVSSSGEKYAVGRPTGDETVTYDSDGNRTISIPGCTGMTGICWEISGDGDSDLWINGHHNSPSRESGGGEETFTETPN